MRTASEDDRIVEKAHLNLEESDTDDLRESRAIPIVKALLEEEQRS